jgi:NRAMP (natural resistance-associated macrophage protein)-like metal ion transporter
MDAIEPKPKLSVGAIVKQLGPGLITGAADDDPSGIATYSQAGAQFGFGMLWAVVATYPLMVGIQLISARIGLVTGHGVAANIRRYYPQWLLHVLVAALLVANTINIAADIGAMGEALQLIVGGPPHGHAVVFGVASALLQVFMPYPRYAPLLKWMVLALFAYVGVVFAVPIHWGEVLASVVWPSVTVDADYMLTIVAVLGTTISPYLFFWQASHEVEEQETKVERSALITAPEQAHEHLKRIRIDTLIGMGFSQLIAFFIMLTTAVTLHSHGVSDIQTSAQAAEALRPIAGDFAFLLFSLGIIGTGMLAIPVLAGSAAYAVAEAFEWRKGLALKPLEARGFYAIIVAATLIGVSIDFTPIDPIKALFWSAVINGVLAVPIMGVMVLLAARPAVMGPFVISRRLKSLGWLTTGLMAFAVALLIALSWWK